MERCKKVSFADEKAALFYIDKLKRTSTRKVLPIRAYLCPHCHTWHLTSQELDSVKKYKEALEASLKLNNTQQKVIERLTKKNYELTNAVQLLNNQVRDAMTGNHKRIRHLKKKPSKGKRKSKTFKGYLVEKRENVKTNSIRSGYLPNAE